MMTTTATPTARTQRIDLGYRARPQFRPFHARKQRWACIVAHRRAGKTVACVMDLVDAALRCTKQEARFAYVAPYYNQAKDAAWTYAKRFTRLVPGAEINESELRIDFAHNGARLRLYGADNYDRMRGGYFDGVILDEYGDMHPAAWPEVIRPMLADRQGWATFIGTPKGRNDFYKVWERAQTTPDWFPMLLRGSESGLLIASELEAMRAEMTPEQYEQEIECNFNAAVVGAYYGKELVDAERAGRIGAHEVDPAALVHTAWDLGIGDSTAIWFFQVAPDGVRFVDHYENHNQPLAHYASVLSARGYRYGDHWVPHDAKVRELGTGRTRIETLKELGVKARLVPDHKVEDGINAARVGFGKFWFHDVRCRQGLEALRQYRSAFDEKLKVFKSTPLHDWTSHTADAFRYAAMAWREMKPKAEEPPKPTELILTANPDGTIKANMSVREIVEAKMRRKRAYG